MKTNCTHLVKVFAAAGLFSTVLACTPQGSNNNPAVVQPQFTEETPMANPIAESGKELKSLTVEDHNVQVGEGSQSPDGQMTLEEILVAHPVLADKSAFLATITKVVETDAGTFDLYVGSDIVMVLSRNTTDSTLMVKESMNGFAADAITWMMADPADQAAMDSIAFTVSHCKVAEKVTEEEPVQEQEQGKTETPVKDEVPAKDVPAEKVEECASLDISLILKSVEQAQEQEQGKVEEPAKEEPVKEEPVKNEEPEQEQDEDQDEEGQA